MTKYSLIYVAGVFVASMAQIVLKRSAKKERTNLIKEYLNLNVILGYGMLFGSTFITIYALSQIELSLGAALESLGYIFVAILSYIFLKEKSTMKQIIGYACIICGVLLFNLQI